MLVNKTNIRALHTAFSGRFYKGLSDAWAISDWRKVGMRVSSSTSEGEYGWIRGVPDLEKEIGSKRLHDMAAARYAIPNDPYSSFIRVKNDDMADDNLGLYSNMFELAGEAAGDWVSNRVMSMLPLGVSTKCFDDQPYFSAAHPNLVGGTYSNYRDNGGSGRAWYLLDNRRVLKPVVWQDRDRLRFYPKNMPTDDNVFFDEDVIWKWRLRAGFGFTLPQLALCSREDLTEQNFEVAITQMSTMNDDLGRKLAIRPTTLIVGPNNEAAAKRLLKATNLANGASNIHAGSLELVVSRFVEDIAA